MTDNDKMLIHIPKDREYIEILGHRIDGFDSFESFCEYLKKCAEMEEIINRQKAKIERLTINMNAFGLGMKREKERADNARAEIERLKQECSVEVNKTLMEFAEIVVADYPEMEYYLDNLVREFTEGG